MRLPASPGRRPPLALLLPAALVVASVAVPLLYLAVRALGADVGGLREIVFRPRTLALLFQTLGLTLAVLALSTLLALPLALLSARSDLRPRPLLMLVGVLPLAIPGYLAATTWLAAGGAGGTLERLTGVAWPVPTGFWGALGVLSLSTFPYLFLNLHAALRAQDGALEDAARVLGRTRWQTLVGVTLPHLRPAWLAGALLVGLHVLGDFATVSLLRYPTFSAAIYQQYAGAYDRTYSAWLALLLLGVTALFLLLEARLMRGVVLGRTSPGGAKPLRRWRLGRALPLAWLYVALLGVAALGVPLVTLLAWLGRGVEVAAWEGLWDSGRTSILLAITAAAVTAALAFPLAYIGQRWGGALARLTERAAYFGYATPPLALALALISFTLAAVPALYQTYTLLILAYALHFTAEAVGPQRSALARATPRLEEAARVLGRTPLGALWRVTLPLVRPGVAVSAAFVFLSVLKELPLTLLLSPVGVETLARTVWAAAEEAQYAQAALPALALVLCGAALAALTWRRAAGERG